VETGAGARAAAAAYYAAKAVAANESAAAELGIGAGKRHAKRQLAKSRSAAELSVRVAAVTEARNARMQARLEAAKRGAEERLEARLLRFVGGDAAPRDANAGAAEKINLHNLASLAAGAGAYSGPLTFGE